MQLAQPFCKFPFRFDVERLQHEALSIPEECWTKHPQDYRGNSALPLISTNGEVNDRFEPPMAPTEYLKRSPYIQQVFSQFRTLLGRARFMRLEPGSGVPPHFDIQLYWRTHTRVHIPIITHPDIRFRCDSEEVHMAAGEAWTFDNWRQHEVVNETPTRRIHLVFDTYGSSVFWSMAKPLGSEGQPRFVPYNEGVAPRLLYETYVGEQALSPSGVDLELARLVADARANTGNDAGVLKLFDDLTVNFRNEWRLVWHMMGPTDQGLPVMDDLIRKAAAALQSIPDALVVASNRGSASRILLSTLDALLTPAAKARVKELRAAATPTAPAVQASPRFDRPVFVVAAPRSGSTLLFEMLAENEAFWTVGGEAHNHIEGVPELNPANRGFQSNRLTADDLAPDVASRLRGHFLATLCDSGRRLYRELPIPRPDPIRFLEKTPKNALRIPFFKAMFPDAKFIFLHREAKTNMSSIIEAWRSGKFVTYRDLPGWSGLPWSLLLIPGWRELAGAEIGKIAMRQWRDTNETIMADLAAMPREDWCCVSYDDVTHNTTATLQRLCAFADVPFSARMRTLAERPLRASRYTLTAPDPEKWKRNEQSIMPFVDGTRSTAEKLARLDPAPSRTAEPLR